jgi:hypothetical protein
MPLHVIAQLEVMLVLALRARHGLHIGGFPLGGAPQDLAIFGGVILLPFGILVMKLAVDRWEASQRREHARTFAIDVAVTLSKSIQLCESVRAAIHAGEAVSDATVEAAIASLDLSRQRLRLYLARRIPLRELIPLATTAEQQLGEGRQAMATLHAAPSDGADPDLAYARQLQTVRAELQSIADHLRGLQPDLGRALAKVEAGWALSD